jgi:hypothetical protein
MDGLVLADFGLGEALLTVLEIFLFIAWFWILISVIGDLFSDHNVSGWGKALWTIVLILAPFLGVFVYLIARGGGMHERAMQRQTAAKQELDNYVRQTAQASPADELAKLAELKSKGTISDAEFERMKAKLVS